MTEIVDVAQLVIRTVVDTDEKYLLARRTEDEYWEFIGGKREENESLREAALRELGEELHFVSSTDVEIREIGSSYPSSVNERFHLHPVLMDLPRSKAQQLSEEDLSWEHDQLVWIDLAEFEEFETLGQYPALESLGIVPRE